MSTQRDINAAQLNGNSELKMPTATFNSPSICADENGNAEQGAFARMGPCLRIIILLKVLIIFDETNAHTSLIVLLCMGRVRWQCNYFRRMHVHRLLDTDANHIPLQNLTPLFSDCLELTFINQA